MNTHMTTRTGSILAIILICCALMSVAVCQAKEKVIRTDKIEAIRVMGANNLPVKVLVVLQPERNLEFVVELVKLVAEIHNVDRIAPADRFKVHVVPSTTARRDQCAALKNRLPPEVWRDFVETNPLFTVDNDIWMQDWGEVGMVKMQGEPHAQLLIIDSNRGRGIGKLPAILANLWNCALLKNPSQFMDCGDYGGNIEVTPDDVLILGNTSTQPLRDCLAMFGYKNRIVIVESDWLKVGHCDEYLSICPNPKAPAGYSIIKANPRLALKLLERADRAELEKIPLADYREMMLAVHDYLNKARARQTATAARADPTTRSFATQVISMIDTTDKDGEMTISRDFVLPDFDMRMGLGSVEGVSGAVSEAKVEAFIKKNIALATLIDSNIQTLANRTREITGDDKAARSVLSFPVLYHEVRTGKHIAYLPGVVNQLILRTHLVIPDPKVEPYRDHIRKVAAKLGLQAHFLDNMYYHNLEGEIHCGTNVFRHPNKYIVKPRSLPSIWDIQLKPASPTR